MSKFQDRKEVLAELGAPVSQSPLVNVFGETGIGKSRVLQEAKLRLSASALVLYIDMAEFKAVSDYPTAILRALIDQAQGRVSGLWQDTDQVAATIVAQLGIVAVHTPVYLMFDTTEAFQDDDAFWDWLHQHLAEPLVVDGRVKQIYAGRIPVRWQRFELRRAVKLVPLGPIPPQDAGRALVEQALLQEKAELKGSEILQAAIDLVLEFSFGHPLLSEKLAAYVARHWMPDRPLLPFKQELCEQVIRPFVDQSLFEGVEPLWVEILWWASVLDWFDPTILQRYLTRVMPELAEKPDYFFIREIARLRTYNTVVWRERRGDRLHGLIRDIVRQCLKTVDPERYRRACLAAAETFQAIADEFPEGEEYAQQFRDEAANYRRRLQMAKEAEV